MGDYGVLEQYLKPYSDSPSSDVTTLPDIDIGPQLSENAPSTSRYQSRGSRNNSLASDSDDSSCCSSSSSSSSSSNSGSTSSFEGHLRSLFGEEGLRVLDILEQKIEIRIKRLLKEILTLGITALDLQRASIHRIIADKCDDYISEVRDEIISTVSRTPLPSPSKRRLVDALLPSLELILEDILETVKSHLSDEERQLSKVVYSPPGQVDVISPGAKPQLGLPTQSGDGQRIERSESPKPPVVEAPARIEELDDQEADQEASKKRFWNHITISRDQTSASNFASEILLAS
ncbi:hypothetical protein F4678DRAFT_111136 [Xylaria arbuscula]|nr:hypothetical protein F4678DRAFT_111136 [Xylaria arbuscula]